eukprot:787400-Pyramimonas_sp.AAC.2
MSGVVDRVAQPYQMVQNHQGELENLAAAPCAPEPAMWTTPRDHPLLGLVHISHVSLRSVRGHSEIVFCTTCAHFWNARGYHTKGLYNECVGRVTPGYRRPAPMNLPTMKEK